MNYQNIRQFSKIIDNSITYDDFVDAGKIFKYQPDYIATIWKRWTINPLYFIASHDMGETIFNMILTKLETEKILNS